MCVQSCGGGYSEMRLMPMSQITRKSPFVFVRVWLQTLALFSREERRVFAQQKRKARNNEGFLWRVENFEWCLKNEKESLSGLQRPKLHMSISVILNDQPDKYCVLQGLWILS